MENTNATELSKTSSMEFEPKTLTKEQYDLARAAAAMHAFEQRNKEATENFKAGGKADVRLDRESHRY